MTDEEPQGTLHRDVTRVLSGLMLLLGIAMVVSTIAAGGGPFALGVILGVLFTCAGAGRIYLSGRR